MRIGLPSIVSKRIAHACLFSDEAVVEYFEPDNINQLSISLTDCIEGRKGLKALSENGVEFSLRFTPKSMVARCLQIHTKLSKENYLFYMFTQRVDYVKCSY